MEAVNKFGLIKIQNLIKPFDESKLQVIDLKIGTSTITLNGMSSQEHQDSRVKKDGETTSSTIGYKITGFVQRDAASGAITDKFYKRPYKGVEETNEAIKRMFYTVDPASNARVYNSKVGGYVLQQLEEMISYFETMFHFEIRGASLLLLIQHNLEDLQSEGQVEMKLIDLASV
eukprot:CAMPEP_0168624124 /NCGR_PEP_ID=MMETSP0449_2-20121227/9229_1 /TAXON_ID=1082188 /ORGANISM="Strombidium rassoulzadegani, Strain ras09" /LENGTH=173 /DNA_ID=CAMNT_0008665627 /DNA_START=165 /DNA_END=682 /DNA_ORIENTATION=+